MSTPNVNPAATGTVADQRAALLAQLALLDQQARETAIQAEAEAVAKDRTWVAEQIAPSLVAKIAKAVKDHAPPRDLTILVQIALDGTATVDLAPRAPAPRMRLVTPAPAGDGDGNGNGNGSHAPRPGTKAEMVLRLYDEAKGAISKGALAKGADVSVGAVAQYLKRYR